MTQDVWGSYFYLLQDKNGPGDHWKGGGGGGSVSCMTGPLSQDYVNFNLKHT